jgi:hypothetical protein
LVAFIRCCSVGFKEKRDAPDIWRRILSFLFGIRPDIVFDRPESENSQISGQIEEIPGTHINL